VIVTLFDQGQARWRCSNLAGRTPPLTTAERDARQAAHVLDESARCDVGELPDGIEDVRAWPIHEPPWQREIIRTQVAES
jgi:hypothetical protein